MRPIEARDVPAVLDLNERNVDLLALMDADRLARLSAWAQRADVIVSGGEVAGFVLVFGSGTDYDSENYRWFSRRYPDRFLYLDRIVLDERFRRLGLGRRVYDAVEADAAAHGRLVLEVNLEPPNHPSLAFHRARGFVEVGRLSNGGKVVALMEKQIG